MPRLFLLYVNLTVPAEVLWAGIHGVISLKLIYPAFPTNSTETLVNKMIRT